jgi:hypothetical protein
MIGMDVSSGKEKKKGNKKDNSFVLVLVFHHTDTYLYLLSLALALSIHNKLQTSEKGAIHEHEQRVDFLSCLRSLVVGRSLTT